MKTKETLKALFTSIIAGLICNTIFSIKMEELINNQILVFAIKSIVIASLFYLISLVYFKLKDKYDDITQTISKLEKDIRKDYFSYSNRISDNEKEISIMRGQIKKLSNKPK